MNVRFASRRARQRVDCANERRLAQALTTTSLFAYLPNAARSRLTRACRSLVSHGQSEARWQGFDSSDLLRLIERGLRRQLGVVPFEWGSHTERERRGETASLPLLTHLPMNLNDVELPLTVHKKFVSLANVVCFLRPATSLRVDQIGQGRQEVHVRLRRKHAAGPAADAWQLASAAVYRVPDGLSPDPSGWSEFWDPNRKELERYCGFLGTPAFGDFLAALFPEAVTSVQIPERWRLRRGQRSYGTIHIRSSTHSWRASACELQKALRAFFHAVKRAEQTALVRARSGTDARDAHCVTYGARFTEPV